MRAPLFAALLLLAACDGGGGGDFGKAVPFARQSLDGTAFVLPRDGDGKVVLLHFWNGGAGGGALLPALAELRRERQERDLLLLAVDVGESREAAAFVAGRTLGYPVVLDPDSALARAYGIAELPVTVLIDREGRVRARIPGTIPFGAVRSALKTLP